jgi:UDP-N-acetylglucosamine acyltransferase
VHWTAVVDPGAELGTGVEIGPYAIVEEGAVLGDRTRVLSHAYVAGCCEVGPDCEVNIGAVLGQLPQIRGHAGPGGGVRIGPRVVIREHATIHRASEPGRWTTLGRGVYLMSCAHVAHDCQVGEDVTIASGTLLAGFVTIQPRAFISGNVVVHQFVQIGELSMTGGGAVISKDVPPFMLIADRSVVHGVNVVGLRRADVPPERRRLVKEAYRLLYRSGLNVTHALSEIRKLPPTPETAVLIDFIEGSGRGICGGAPRARRRRGTSESPPPSDP